ncbi:MAG: ComEC/Rec2 family competence protein [Candidatus Moranbacteria bacterium]|nr:ComEC/Rec2 family competence protein [Candidatus Moranbacteria bacterium]
MIVTKSRILLSILLGFIGGVFTASFFVVNQNYYFLLLLFSLILLFIFYKNKLAALAAFIVFTFVFGWWITDMEMAAAKDLPYAGQTFAENAVVEKVSASSFGQNVIFRFPAEKISMLLQVPQYPEYAYGDLLKISCIAKAIENKDPNFDYRMYMAKEGVLYQCDKAKASKIGENQGNWFYAKIISARTVFEDKINQVIPAPYGALAIGLLLGGSSGLSKEIQNDFSRTGMTHIVAVSGYNVTIVAEYLILLGIFLGLWRKQAIWFAVVGIILFVVMSGLPASAVRAGVMSGILLWAMKNGRLANSENTIIFAGAVMLFLNPLLLRYDVGFQLSFLATLGIVLSSPFWEKSFVKKHQAFGISEVIVLSLSAQIFVLPIIAYNFHIASLVSLLANVFILPIIPLSMLLVFLVCIFGFVFVPLSLVFSWLAFLLLFYEIKLIHVLSQFPWASVEIENPSVSSIVIYYIILTYVVILIKKSQISISNVK